MKTQTVATHLDLATDLDLATLDRFRSVTQTENRSPSQVLSVSLKAFLDQAPGPRRALFAIDGIADEEERAFATRLIGRAILKAYEGIIDARRADFGPRTDANEALASEEAIEAEAVRMCRP